MNSITLLKKQNKELEKLQNEAARSSLIEKLQKDITEQELVIETMRKFFKTPEDLDKVD